MSTPPVQLIRPGQFASDAHYYARVPNTRLHPLVRSFLSLGNQRMVQRYCHLHPEADPAAVAQVLSTVPRSFRWAGADLLHVTDERGVRGNIVIETNSCPSGQKSMPLRKEDDDLGGYRLLLERSFLPMVRAARKLPEGRLAVLWDKNEMETSGYAAALADLTGEPVLRVHLPRDGWEAHARFDAGVLSILHEGQWEPIRAAFRYVTQQPWTRIPPITRTLIYNPVLACLAGGRNKLLASKAYDLFNADMAPTGLGIRVPETIWDVALPEVPLWVERMGGVAVVKDPYSNAGQGVFTITSARELQAFMDTKHRYDRFIVQALVGNLGWTSRTQGARLYHVGTVPDRHNRIYVADTRFMVGVGPEGFFPIAIYARRAAEPLADALTDSTDSWSMLGTNLSVKTEDGWTTASNRLMLMDERDFNRLGLGLDDLTEAYLQTCMAVIAIDRMAERLRSARNTFRRRLFRSLVPDPALVEEIAL